MVTVNFRAVMQPSQLS